MVIPRSEEALPGAGTAVTKEKEKAKVPKGRIRAPQRAERLKVRAKGKERKAKGSDGIVNGVSRDALLKQLAATFPNSFNYNKPQPQDGKGTPNQNAKLVPGQNGYKTKLCKYVLRCLLYTSPSPRDRQKSRMPSSA